MKQKDLRRVARIRLFAIGVLSLFVLITGGLYAYSAFSNGDFAGAVLGAIIAVIILGFGLFAVLRGNNDLRNGFPVRDERSTRVMEKASSKAFYFSLYGLLAVGFLSDGVIVFRDVSQATGVCVGVMGLLFGVFWLYYDRKEF